jgi:predicted ATPase
MVASVLSDQPEVVRKSPGIEEGVLPVAAIYGANASGKSNVILALRFMKDAIRNSHARWEPDKPIELQAFAGALDSPSTFSVDFLLDGIRYQYGFSVGTSAILGAPTILEEWLHAYPSGKIQRWFAREPGKPISFSAKMQGDNRMIERLTRPNSLFLSAAAQNNHEALSPVYRWFSRSLSFVLGERSTVRHRASSLYHNVELRKKAATLLSVADLGIEDLTVREVAVPKAATDFAARVALLYAVAGGKEPLEVQFLHRIGGSAIPFDESQESKGTIAFLCLLDPVIRAIRSGGLVCVDELEDSLHPLLAMEVIRQFSDTKKNAEGAQLIFNTHDTNLLSAGILRRDQIWFTEKRRDGASQLYPLTDFKPRKQENLENGYLQGRYGAIPFLNPDRFLKATHEEE